MRPGDPGGEDGDDGDRGGDGVGEVWTRVVEAVSPGRAAVRVYVRYAERATSPWDPFRFFRACADAETARLAAAAADGSDGSDGSDDGEDDDDPDWDPRERGSGDEEDDDDGDDASSRASDDSDEDAWDEEQAEEDADDAAGRAALLEAAAEAFAGAARSRPARVLCVYATPDESATSRCATVERAGEGAAALATLADARLTPSRVMDVVHAVVGAAVVDPRAGAVLARLARAVAPVDPDRARDAAWARFERLVLDAAAARYGGNDVDDAVDDAVGRVGGGAISAAWSVVPIVAWSWPSAPTAAQVPSDPLATFEAADAPGPLRPVANDRGVSMRAGAVAVVFVSDAAAASISAARDAATAMFDPAVVGFDDDAVADVAGIVVLANARAADDSGSPAFRAPAPSPRGDADARSARRRCFVGGVPPTTLAVASHAILDAVRRYENGSDFGGGPDGRFARDGDRVRADRARAVATVARVVNRLADRIRARLWRPDSRLVRDVYAPAWYEAVSECE